MKRWILRALVFLPIGALISVAVTWSACLWQPTRTQLNQDLTSREARGRYPDQELDHGFDALLATVVADISPGCIYATEFIFQTKADDPGARCIRVERTTCRAGWPMAALQGTFRGQTDLLKRPRSNFDGADRHAGALRVSWRNSGPRALPCRPLLPGLLVNSALYGGMLWSFTAVTGYVRRRVRVRRDQCAACGYPVGSFVVCPECGKPVKARPTAATTAMSKAAT